MLQGILDRAACCSNRPDELLGPVELADGERSLDRVALDAPDRRLAETDLFDQRQRTRRGARRRRRAARRRARPSRASEGRACRRSVRFDRLRRAACAHCFQPPEVGVEIRLPVDGDVRTTELIADRGQSLGDLFGARPVAVPELENQPVEQDVDEGGLVAFLLGCVFGLGKLQPCAVELVDVAQPLAELERDPVVDRRRLRRVPRARARAAQPAGRSRYPRTDPRARGLRARTSGFPRPRPSARAPRPRRVRLTRPPPGRRSPTTWRGQPGSARAGSGHGQLRVPASRPRSPPTHPRGGRRGRRDEATHSRGGRDRPPSPRDPPGLRPLVRARRRARGTSQGRGGAAARRCSPAESASVRARSALQRRPERPARERRQPPARRRAATSSSGPEAARARWRARSSGSSTISASARCASRRRATGAEP